MAAETAAQPSAKTRALYDKILAQCQQMIEMAKENEESLGLKREAVSGWSVLQHLEHMAKADGGICLMRLEGALKKPPQHADKGCKFPAKVVLLTGWLPRGKGKSPKELEPTAPGLDQARATINGAMMFIKRLEPRLAEIEASEGRSDHPVLGYFTAIEWMKFLDIHHRHHFKIIRDIRAAK